jgi:hypothetical protein
VSAGDGRPTSAPFLLHRRLRSGHSFPPTEVLVALTIAGYMHQEEHTGALVAWPSVATIAKTSGLCERAVRKAINAHLQRREPLFVRAGGVDVGRPRKVHRYALVLDPAAFELNRHHVPMKTTAETTPGSADPSNPNRHQVPMKTTPEVVSGQGKAAPGSGKAAPGAGLNRHDVPMKICTEGTREEEPRARAEDWFTECLRLHGRSCNGSRGHRLRMALDRERRPQASTP